MSNYSAFFAQDFAERCHDLLRHFYQPAVAHDREVTLLLAIAAAGLVVPYERLSVASGQPLLDRRLRGAEAHALKQLLAETIYESNLLKSTLRDWTGGRLVSAEGDPDQWPELRQETPLAATATVAHLVECLRHALAHGNVTLRGGHQIDQIVFVCGYSPGHSRSKANPLRYVAVAPDPLKRFLEEWFSSMTKLRVTRAVLAAALNEADAA